MVEVAVAAGDWRSERHASARDRLLDAAWRLAERDGVGGLSLRELAREVGMSPPSVYSYFDGKHAIYDAMFAQGYEAFADMTDALPVDEDDVLAVLATSLGAFVDFCRASQPRYQLMFQRPVPDFEPSPEAYAHSERALAAYRDVFGRVVGDDDRLFDLALAVGAGLAAQQMSNDPSGDRWIGLVDEAAQMFHQFVTTKGQA